MTVVCLKACSISEGSTVRAAHFLQTSLHLLNIHVSLAIHILFLIFGLVHTGGATNLQKEQSTTDAKSADKVMEGSAAGMPSHVVVVPIAVVTSTCMLHAQKHHACTLERAHCDIRNHCCVYHA